MSQITATSPVTKIQINHEVAEPPFYKVIYINDDKTSMDFVIESLIEFFDYDPFLAKEITENIHTDGSAVVAILPYEIAEQKGIEVTMSARQKNYPLQIKLEATDLE
jgi:ATP-dependent Clp protease adaptor protein ClpS